MKKRSFFVSYFSFSSLTECSITSESNERANEARKKIFVQRQLLLPALPIPNIVKNEFLSYFLTGRRFTEEVIVYAFLIVFLSSHVTSDLSLTHANEGKRRDQQTSRLNIHTCSTGDKHLTIAASKTWGVASEPTNDMRTCFGFSLIGEEEMV